MGGTIGTNKRLGSLTAAGLTPLFAMMRSRAEGRPRISPERWLAAGCAILFQARREHGLALDVGCAAPGFMLVAAKANGGTQCMSGRSYDRDDKCIRHRVP